MGLWLGSVLRFPLRLVGLPPRGEGRVFWGKGGLDAWFSSRSIIFLHKRINAIGSFRQVIQFSNHCIIRCPLFSVVSENGFLRGNDTTASMDRIQLSQQIQDALFVLFYFGFTKCHRVRIFVIPHDFFEKNTQLHIGVGRILRRQAPVEDGLDITLGQFQWFELSFVLTFCFF